MGRSLWVFGGGERILDGQANSAAFVIHVQSRTGPSGSHCSFVPSLHLGLIKSRASVPIPWRTRISNTDIALISVTESIEDQWSL